MKLKANVLKGGVINTAYKSNYLFNPTANFD
uniref:Uncharacterized protein n=1 Tax=Arundo donax TaxID=35708 RepID=A0A0A8YTD4_ARUDO